jgi:hypothetical protein
MVMNEVHEVGEVKEAKEPARRGGPVKRYTDLPVYRQSHRLVLQVSQFPRSLPREAQFELGRQSGQFGAANASEYGKLGFMLHNLWKEWRKL